MKTKRTKKRLQSKRCVVPGCTKDARTLDRCASHYKRLQRQKDKPREPGWLDAPIGGIERKGSGHSERVTLYLSPEQKKAVDGWAKEDGAPTTGLELRTLVERYLAKNGEPVPLAVEKPLDLRRMVVVKTAKRREREAAREARAKEPKAKKPALGNDPFQRGAAPRG